MEVSVGNYATFNTDQCEQFAHSHYAAAPDWGGSVAEWLACWTQTQKGLGEAQWVRTVCLRLLRDSVAAAI